MARRKSLRELTEQWDRVFKRTYSLDPNNYDRSSRWQRFHNAAQRYAANIRNSRYANNMDAQVPRRVYMGLNAG